MIPRVVFDCVVFLQAAARKSGPAAASLQLAKTGVVELCIHTDLMTDLEDVMTRPRTQRRFPALTREVAYAFLRDVKNHATTIADVLAVFALPRDPKDAPYVDLAVASNARYLVTRDKDLLELMRDQAFRRRFPQLVVLDPVAFLREIARLSGEDVTA